INRIQLRQLRNVFHWQRMKQDGVDHGKDRGVCANSQGQRQNRYHAEAGVFEQHACAVPDVLPEVLDFPPPPDDYPTRRRYGSTVSRPIARYPGLFCPVSRAIGGASRLEWRDGAESLVISGVNTLLETALFL